MAYHLEGVVASYPYTFDVDDNNVGIIQAFVYDQVKVDDTQRKQVNEKLSQLETQDNSGYELQEDKVVYVSKGNVDEYKDIEHAEVGIRRHFIEDFIETDEDLREIVKPFGAHTLKTEFVIEE